MHTDYGSLDSSAVPGTPKSIVFASEQVLIYAGTLKYWPKVKARPGSSNQANPMPCINWKLHFSSSSQTTLFSLIHTQ